MADLVDLTRRLRAGVNPNLNPQLLADGYLALRASAPARSSRNLNYRSGARTGIPSNGAASNRQEEHLAMALFRKKEIFLATGQRLRLLDYQFPLKARQADRLGKIDLLAAFDDGGLAVVELKMASSREDSRVGLLEALTYAAVVEGNLDYIVREFAATGIRIAPNSPALLLVAASAYWLRAETGPAGAGLYRLMETVSSILPISIAALDLHDANLKEMGLNGAAPRIEGHAYLSLRAGTLPAQDRREAGQMDAYLTKIRSHFWKYAQTLPDPAGMLRSEHAARAQSPVFTPADADRNVALPPQASRALAGTILAAIPKSARNKWFASMASSQALAQTVFAGLDATGTLRLLEGLRAEDGRPAFFESFEDHRLELEHAVDTLGEPRPTSLDALLTGSKRVAVEVKLTEAEFGRCSRPALSSCDPNFESDHCNGIYSRQRGRAQRCSLAERGIAYWDYLPKLFHCNAEQDHDPCPLAASYQLVRNVLAACVCADGSVDTSGSHALVIYDGRNPAFLPGGVAHMQWWSTVSALRHPQVLRRVSWQTRARHFAQFPEVTWLTIALRLKYGIEWGSRAAFRSGLKPG